jgi:Phospholipase_D-nuclease N-terminal
MVLASATFGDFLWSLLIFFFMVMYFVIIFQVIVDVFRSPASGVSKALWLLCILIFPVVALVAYVIVHGSEMNERRGHQRTRRSQTDLYLSTPGSTGGPASEIARAQHLLENGAISQAEFDRLKANALAS